MELDRQKEIVNKFLNAGILLSDDVLRSINEYPDLEEKHSIVIDHLNDNGSFMLTKEILNPLLKKQPGSKVFIDKNNIQGTVKIITSYSEGAKKRGIQDFVAFFNARYKALEKVLRGRQELNNLTSIGRLISKKDKENVSIIGMVADKRTTSKGGMMLTLEDLTGKIKVYVNNNSKELFEGAKDIVLDEVIAVIGVSGDNILFSNKILWPDVPLNRELKKSPDECYAIFLSDMHVGSNNFLPDEFNQFWKTEDMRCIRIPVKAPKANSFCETYIGKTKAEVLNNFICFSRGHLDHILRVWLKYYHEERPHRGVGRDNTVLDENFVPMTEDPIRCKSEFGGILKSYYREAA